MDGYLVQRLKKIASESGTDSEHTISPARHAGQSEDDFQTDVDRLRGYADEELLEILAERKEDYTGGRNVVGLKIPLTEDGVAEWGDGRREVEPVEIKSAGD